MTTHEILHIIRNPWGWSEEEVRQARLAAADLIEQQAAELAILKQKNPNVDRNPSEGDTCGRSCEGQAYRIELRQALAKVEQQAKQIEALRGFAQAVLIDGAYGFDPERLPKIAVNFGLITSKAVNHGSTGFECPVIYTEKTSLLTGR